MPPVNLDGVPAPEEPPQSPHLVSGRELSRRNFSRARAHSESHLFPRDEDASRPRARTDSFRRLHLSQSIREDSSRPRARTDSFRRLHLSQPSIHEDSVSRPRLRVESRRRMFQHRRSNSSPAAVLEEEEEEPRRTLSSSPNVVKEEDSEDEKEEDNEIDVEEQQDNIMSESGPKRTQSFSEGSNFTEGNDDDDTIQGTGFDFDSPLSADQGRSSIVDTGPRQLYLFGYAIPLWCTSRPNATRISTFIAKHAPCFWCSRERLSLTTTNQAILMRLGSLCGFLGLCQAGSASYLLIVLLSVKIVDRNAQYVERGTSPRTETVPSLWNLNTYVFLAGFLGAIVLIVMICARGTFRDLDLTGSLRFMWMMLWLIPLEVFATIGLFDYHGVTEVWITHWWTASLMAWFRSKSCKAGTYNTLCVVPIDGLPEYNSEDEWCLAYYNSTRCAPIRDDAQRKMLLYSKTFYNVNGALGVLTVIMLCLLVNFLEGIITRPIVQKSRESNLPLWLTFPIIGCFFTGAITIFSSSSILQRNAGTENFWPGISYIVAGGLYTLAAVLGYFLSHFAIMNQRDKRTKRLAVLCFIILMMLTLVLVASIFVQSILQSSSVVNIPLNDQLRGELACTVAASSCSYCDVEGERECPEWTDDDVKVVLQTQLKASAALAAIFMIYSVGALRFGFILRSHIIRYQIDYV